MKTQVLSTLLIAAAAGSAVATPIYDTFGPLPEATFNPLGINSGIPNDEVAIGTQLYDGTTITAGLTAHKRYGNPDVPSDGAGNFTATTGSNTGPGSPVGTSEGALWNFAYYITVEGGGRTIEDLQFNLYYDFDTGEDTNIVDLGVIDITAGVALLDPGAGVSQNSQNLLFDFLENPTSPADTFITPPAGSFDPNALGEYNFAIVASDPDSGFAVEIVAIDVQVVPEPSSLALLAVGGLAGLRRRRIG